MKHKTELVAKLEEKTNQMAVSIREMEDQYVYYYISYNIHYIS